MRIEPLSKFENKTVAIVIPGHRAMTVISPDGESTYYGVEACREQFEAMAGWVVYSLDALLPFVHTTGAKEWAGTVWKGRDVSIKHLGSKVTVRSLRGILEPQTAMHDLLNVLKFLRSYGVSPGSIPQMAWGLFRASLNRTYNVGADADLGKAAFYGGRKEITKVGTYKDLQHVDIAQAYPAVMALKQGYALSLRECSPETYLDPFAAGIAYAKVYVPESLPFAPLPIRVADDDFISYQKGHIEGTWAWCELDAAQKVGAEITVLKSWAPDRQADLFGPWWPLAQEGRKLPGGAAQLAKAIANSTWGQFGMRQDAKQIKTWVDDAGTLEVLKDEANHLLPHSYAAHIAAETTARVRSQLLLEGLYGGGSPVHCDTDGIIIPTGSPMTVGNGDPGTWRVKADIASLDLRAAQLYRWTCPGCGVAHEHWHYSAAGIPAEDAPGFFTGTPGENRTMEWQKDFSGEF